MEHTVQMRKRGVPALLWLLLLGVALLLDAPVARWAHQGKPTHRINAPTLPATSQGWAGRMLSRFVSPRWEMREIIRAPGHGRFTLLVALLFCLFHPRRWRPAARLILCALAIGALVPLVKWSVGRARPGHGLDSWHLDPFRGGPAGVFHLDRLTFPSGDAALAFATAACVAVYFPAWRPALYAVASLTAVQRVFTGAHYVSDVVVAAALGIASTWLVGKVIDRLRAPQPKLQGTPVEL